MKNTYTILGVKQAGDTLFTVVLYDVDGEKKEVSIPHFQPQSADDVLRSIENRFASEHVALSCEKTCAQIASQLAIGEVVEIL